MTAKGWAWFEYTKKVTPTLVDAAGLTKIRLQVKGHYYCRNHPYYQFKSPHFLAGALNIETYIPDASQRSSSIDFTAAISATDDSQYKGTCS
jgi:hypothetical protein